MPKRKKPRTASTVAINNRARANAQACYDAAITLQEDGGCVVVFGPDDEIVKIHKTGFYHMDNDRVAAAESFPSDPSSTYIKIPETLYGGIFEKMPPFERVTVGEGRRIRNGTLKPIMVLGNGCQSHECPYLFGPDDCEHFSPRSSFTEEMNDAHVGDNESFYWTPTSRSLIKITKELLAWSRHVLAAVALLGSHARRDTMRSYSARLDAITPDSAVFASALHVLLDEITKQQNAYPREERSVEYCKLAIKHRAIENQIAIEYQQMRLEQAVVHEEWDAARARMLAASEQARKKTQPKIMAALALITPKQFGD